jgi:hypothetical protein
MAEGHSNDVQGGHAPPNGALMAAVLAAGIGSFAMGAVVIIGELGVIIPALYQPAGGVSGRTTVAALIWLAGWAVLHNRWKHRELDMRPIQTVTLVLVGMGLLLTFPPVWGLL